ncbi:MAG TPA: DUF1559 domain-containing protein [Gemmataceae bacterium]|nr:DUF1559 domain-containing protein [Gemmataceae bacterium]
MFLMGPSETVLQECSKRPPTPQPAGRLAAALRVAAQPESHAVVALNVPSQLLRDLCETLPPQAQGVRPAAEAEAASLALTLSPLPDGGDGLELKVHSRLTFADAGQAERGLSAVGVGLELLHRALTELNGQLGRGELRPEDLAQRLGAAPSFGNACLQFMNPAVYTLGTAERQRGRDTVHVRLTVRTDAPVVDPALMQLDQARIRDVNNRNVSRQRLEAIGKALKQYDKDQGRLPPAELRSKDGRPLLSWRVLVLPYLGEKDLYLRFDQIEPWDGPNNQKLLDPVFRRAFEGPDSPGPDREGGRRLGRRGPTAVGLALPSTGPRSGNSMDHRSGRSRELGRPNVHASPNLCRADTTSF